MVGYGFCLICAGFMLSSFVKEAKTLFIVCAILLIAQVIVA